jgi:uncharacterized protein (DUF885 family)
MADVVLLIGDMTRLRAELESHRAQLAKSKAKGRKDAVKEIGKTIAETEAFYAAARDQLPPEVAAEAERHMDQLDKAQAALDKVHEQIQATAAPAGVPAADAAGTAHDATVEVG